MPLCSTHTLMGAHSVTIAEEENLLRAALRQGVDLPHDCGGALACVSCQVVVRDGLERLDPAGEDEIDLLDRAGIAEHGVRLACQATGTGTIVFEIPQLDLASGNALQPVKVSANAAAFFAQQLAKHPGALAVRLAVRLAGCSGFRYVVDPAASIGPEDHLFESEGIRVVVDSASLQHLQGTTLDIVQDGLARRLDFANPNVIQTCGCGQSFGTS
jgi:iron-sulfur cluster assembly protein